MSEKTQRPIELVYRIQPRIMDQIIDRLDDISPAKLTGTTLLKTGSVYRLILAMADQKTADQVKMRMREFFPIQVRLLPGETLIENLRRGFERIIPGDAFTVWREQGWEGALDIGEALDWIEQES